MPLVSNHVLHIVILKNFLKTEWLTPPASSIFVHELAELYVIKLQYSDLEEKPLINWLINQNFIKIFENYWFSYNISHEGNNYFLDEFFSFLAPTYESSIIIEKNISCYNFLINKAIKIKSCFNSRTLDFGSGTGTIIYSPYINNLDEVIGFDFSVEMQNISQKKGLKTLSSVEFDSLPSEYFDIIILNYVLHLCIDSNLLNRLLNLLVKDGILVGNVHKGLGLKNIKTWLSSIADNFLYEIEESDYGTVITIKKI